MSEPADERFDPTAPEVALPRWVRHLGWDGVLPLLVILSPTIFRWCLPLQRDAVEFFAALVVPIGASLVRCVTGWNELQRICGEHPAIHRQLLLVVAILVLMFFEIGMNALQFARGGPQWIVAWLIPIGIYVSYLLSMFLAFRSPVKE